MLAFLFRDLSHFVASRQITVSEMLDVVRSASYTETQLALTQINF